MKWNCIYTSKKPKNNELCVIWKETKSDPYFNIEMARWDGERNEFYHYKSADYWLPLEEFTKAVGIPSFTKRKKSVMDHRNFMVRLADEKFGNDKEARNKALGGMSMLGAI